MKHPTSPAASHTSVASDVTVAQPFFEMTIQLFDYVRTHDFDRLAQLCDDDFGIIDIGPEGGAHVVRTRAEWEDWFHGLFQKLSDMQADTFTHITDYHAMETAEMGYSVVYFDQMLAAGGQSQRFPCCVTIIWKATDDGWKESRWHVSIIGQPEPVPDV